MPRVIRSIVVILVVVASLWTGTTPAAAATHTVTATAPTSYVAGDYATVKVKVSNSFTGTARLQYKSGSSWVTASRTITVSKGIGSTTVAPSAARSYRIKVSASYSGTFTVTPVKVTVTGSASPSTIAPGKASTATVKISPAIAAHGTLQYKSGDTWTTATRILSIASGKATTTLAPSSTRTYRFKVGAYYSPAFTVTVTTTPASFTVQGSGWGHGVGMSQYGAYGMARDGYDAPQILTHYYTGTQVETVAANPEIRVQVFGSGSDSKSAVDLVVRSPGSDSTDNGEWRMRFYATAGDPSPANTWYGINNEDLVISQGGGKVTVKREDGTTASGALVSFHWEATTFYQTASTEDPYVELLNKAGGSRQTHGQYRHGRMLITVIDGRINMVNALKLNTEYLNGIGEMPSSWSAEALKAQAITARGFAVRKHAAGLASACACNLYDDPRSQNFSGWLKESEGTDAYYGKRWLAAVAATSSSAGANGQVLTYGAGGVGTIATTYYFSSSGGQTENSEDVWSSTVSYLRSVDDPWSVDGTVNNPNDAWTAKVSQAAMRAAFGVDEDVLKVSVSKRTSSASTAAAYELTATLKSGATAKITGADRIRIKLGVKSPWLWSVSAS